MMGDVVACLYLIGVGIGGLVGAIIVSILFVTVR